MDIIYQSERGILRVEPAGPLSASNFRKLADEMERIRSEGRALRGILIRTAEFPGYEKISDAFAHAKFVKEHGDDVRKVAICTNSVAGNVLAFIGQHVVGAYVKRFHYDEQPQAEAWILA